MVFCKGGGANPGGRTGYWWCGGERGAKKGSAEALPLCYLGQEALEDGFFGFFGGEAQGLQLQELIAGDLADDKFALFVAGEPHMPTLEFPGDGAQPVKKICFKLLADAYWEE